MASGVAEEGQNKFWNILHVSIHSPEKKIVHQYEDCCTWFTNAANTAIRSSSVRH